MLDFAAQLVAQAAPSSALAFCLCNLLVAAIFMGSKSASKFEEMSVFSLLPVVSPSSVIVVDREETIKSGYPAEQEKAPLTGAVELCVAENLENIDRECNNEKKENEDNGSIDDHDDISAFSLLQIVTHSSVIVMDQEERVKTVSSAEQEKASLAEAAELCVADNFEIVERERDYEDEVNDSNNDDDHADAEQETEDDDTNNEDEDGDELRRRIEEFIDKVNSGWKAEKLRDTMPCVWYEKNLNFDSPIS